MRDSEPLLPFPGTPKTALFVSREKRFTVRARDPESGAPLLAHTNNTGSMLGLLRPGCELLLSPAANPARKLPWTLECVRHQGFWTGVNTLTPNRLLAAAFRAGALPEIRGADAMRPEARHGESRLDALFLFGSTRLWVEAKNVTMSEYEVALFPDAATERGRKHLRELAALATAGDRAALFFCIQRPDARCFGPADFIDPEYAKLLYEVMDLGVEVWPYLARADDTGIRLGRRLPVTRG